ncbi:12899_t:CDS:10, partial [Acaulospora colombiana]
VTTIVLGWWTSKSVHGFQNKEYMAVYAGVGGAQAVIAFLGAFAFALSRDVESLDNQLPNAMYQLMRMLASAIGLIFYTFPYLGIAIPFLFALYYAASAFYRRTSIETKRLDSILRSTLYANLGEALTGLSTIHAWRAQDHYLKLVDTAIGEISFISRKLRADMTVLDGQNRAYILSVLVQRWLAIRLDLLANLLVLGIGFFAVGLRKSSDPSKTGVVLSYTLAITQTLSQMVTQMARSEQEMNAVERLDHYGKLPGEAPPTTNHDPDAKWPEKGEIRFQNVDMAYRPGLPLVLKGISFDVKAGEKIGIVGRTGAGKSSMLQALFRIVEIEEGGKIEIDGINTKEIGLDILRQRLAVIPQDALLFKGTVRENIDPLNQRTDAELLSAMRRSGLLSRSEEDEGKAKAMADGTQDAVNVEVKGENSSTSRFDLGAAVSEEGSNFSAGERQLIALCRALVKESRVIVMDEATSNVDVETDAQIQRTIQQEFARCTLLCIAHRLNTIVYYDRILVLDQGHVAEFDTPLALYDREDSIFRSLCSEASLNRQDIIRIRSAVHSGHAEEIVQPVHQNETIE